MAHDERADIRRLADDWSKALERKDIEGLTRGYADDVVLFDVAPPGRIDGLAGYREVWERRLADLPDRLATERRRLAVEVSGDLAFAHGLHRFSSSAPWVRFTICYRRVNGAWRVAHEHVSLPFDMASGNVVAVTDPDDGA